MVRPVECTERIWHGRVTASAWRRRLAAGCYFGLSVTDVNCHVERTQHPCHIWHRNSRYIYDHTGLASKPGILIGCVLKVDRSALKTCKKRILCSFAVNCRRF